jgi:uncharacterized surface protein with fasciclin (FAS1) repeats
MRKFLTTLVTAGLALGLMAAPAAANKGKPNKAKQTIVEKVVKLSGPAGFDANPNDFDILREAAVATGFANKLGGKRQLTVFAPPDQAFLDLTGASTEEEAFNAVAELGLPTVRKVLRYHVAPGKRGAKQVVASKRIPTLLKGSFLKKRSGSTKLRDATGRKVDIVAPNAVRASNGIVHAIDGVLLPFAP